MIYELSNKIWWGDHGCADHKRTTSVRSILNVAWNLGDVSYRFNNFPLDAPYFRFTLDEDRALPLHDARTIRQFFQMVKDWERFPFLIHCRAGQHRSPVLAVCAESFMTGRSIEDAMADAKRARPSLHRFESVFALSVFDYFRDQS